MEEAERRVLGQFRTRLANEIVVTTSFLSAFCAQSVLDEEMSRIVKSEDNYTAKAHKLLELLPKRGPKAFSTLVEILENTNPWLAEKMKSALHEEHNREAKLKITGSSSEAASIKGYGSSNLRNVDNDLKASAHQFVKTTLHHLTDSEQRTTERWISEEMQRERRRQQFRTPHSLRRHPEEFQSRKEVQTDMKGMEFQELCEDIMIQLHGVDYAGMNCDLSFKMLQKQVSEMLLRQQKMDLLFIQCLEKFDYNDRYTLSLPELIDRSVLRQKELVKALMEDRRKIQRMTEQMDALERHAHRLEDEMDLMFKRQSHSVVHPQQMYLKKRKELQVKYTMTKPRGKSAGGASSAAAGAEGHARTSQDSSVHILDSSLDHGEERATAGGGDGGGGGGAVGGAVGGGSGSGTSSRGGVSSTSSGSASPKSKVRFSSATGHRAGTARRRPATSSSGPGKSVLKYPAK